MLFKLTYQDGTTRKGEENETQWGRGVTHKADGKRPREGRWLCTDQVIHAYRSPEIAAFSNMWHAQIPDPICWRARGRVLVDDGRKIGCKTLTTLEIVPLPVLTKQHEMEIALRTIQEEKAENTKNWCQEDIGFPIYVIANIAASVIDKRAFAERLTARIKQVIREGANPPAGGIKPDMIFFDEGGE